MIIDDRQGPARPRNGESDLTQIETSSELNESESAVPRINGYRVLRRLGLGGMATVYLAVQESLDREVAIKVMRPTRQLDEEQSTRFEHEARIIARLEHPSIVVIHEVGRTETGDLYYVMPYLAKGDLSMRDFRDDEIGLVALLRALLDALGYAHARGIVHRDVKAENVLFDIEDRPQLADFGIALAQREVNSRITGAGLVIGTSAQMSPEQARADNLDGRSDLYSLGVLTYELLTGELPFHSSDPLSLALMHAQDPVPRLPADKAHWQTFVDCAMAKRPAQRYRNAQAMQRALDPLRRRARKAATPMGHFRHAMRTRPVLLIATGLLLAISLISLSVPLLARWQEQRAAPEQVSTPVFDVGESKTLADLDALAKQQLSTGAVLTPTGANAAETWLVMLHRDRENPLAVAGIKAVIDKATPSLLEQVSEDDPEGVRKVYLKIELIADLAQVRESEAFQRLRKSLSEALHERASKLVDAGKIAKATTWLRVSSEIGFDNAESQALDARLQGLPQPGRAVRDPGGMRMMLVPASIDGANFGKQFMMMRDEVSRDDYARFAQRTKRVATRCRNRISPLRIFDRRSWSDPGFKQSGAEPVVCISYDDARAYATWLSRQQALNYRLPSKSEWLHAARSIPRKGGACSLGNVRDQLATGIRTQFACRDGFANTAPPGKYAASTLGINDLRGNVAEWTSSCTSTSKKECDRRAALGMSWQDGPGTDANALRDLPAARGYDDVGFRLVRDP